MNKFYVITVGSKLSVFSNKLFEIALTTVSLGFKFLKPRRNFILKI